MPVHSERTKVVSSSEVLLICLGTISIGFAETVDLTVTSSNGQPLDEGAVINQLVEFESQDEAVALVELDEEGNLLITAVGVGSTTIEVTRKDDTNATRRPDLPAIVVTPVTVNVT